MQFQTSTGDLGMHSPQVRGGRASTFPWQYQKVTLTLIQKSGVLPQISEIT